MTSHFSTDLLASHVKTFNLDLDGFKSKLQSNSRNFLRFASHNARSLSSSHSFYVDLLTSIKLTAFSVSETWLKSSIPSKQVELPGFSFFRHDRTYRGKKHGGGVGIYVQKGVKSKILLASEKGCEFEYLFLELAFNGVKVVFGVVYRPPWSSVPVFVESFDRILTELSSSYARVIISGDFNIDLNIMSPMSSSLLSSIERHSLKIIPSGDTCHTLNNRSSKIDLMLVSDSSSVRHLYQSSAAGISDHDMLAVDFRFKGNTGGSKTFTYRSFDSIDIPSLLSDASSLPWNMLYETITIDEKMEMVNRYLSGLLERHAPLKSVTIDENSAPWITANVRQSFRQRDSAYRQWLSSRTISDWNNFCRQRNHNNRLVKSVKKSYSEKQLDPRLGTNVLWKNVRKLGLMDSNHSIGSGQFSSADFNKHFTNSQANISSNNNMIFDDWNHQFSFSFSYISNEDILKSVIRISSDAVGVDGIPIKFIKMLLPVLSTFLCHVFNHMIMTSTFPSCWKVGHVIPVAKISIPKSVKDYRPISLLPSLSKVFEHILHDQITLYLDRNSLLNPFQSGFRKNCGTTTALVRIVDDLKLSMDAQSFSILVLLDFSKAFDSIDHRLLISKLDKKFGFESSAVKLIKSYLCDRSQYVEVDKVRSETAMLSCGVPQGSILGPLLFSLFINDLPSVLNDCSFHMYADDVQIYASGSISNQNSVLDTINKNIENVYNWSLSNGLVLNAAKTQTIKICKKSVSNEILKLPNVTVGSISVPYSRSVKNLGLILDQHLDFQDHINSICKSVYGGLHSLNRLRYCTPLESRKKLFGALILPYFHYCDVIYSASSVGTIQRLQLALNSCLRYVLNLKKFDHISQYSTFLLGCDLSTYLNFRAVTFLYKILNHPVPSYLLPYRSYANSERTSNISIPSFSRGCNFSTSFRVRSAVMWNSIQPHNIKRSTSISSFKKKYLSSILVET